MPHEAFIAYRGIGYKSEATLAQNVLNICDQIEERGGSVVGAFALSELHGPSGADEGVMILGHYNQMPNEPLN